MSGPDLASRPRILVTGSSGVIGTALLPALRGAGFGVLAFDRAQDRTEELLSPQRSRLAISGCGGVVHLAGCSRVAWARTDPALAFRDNVLAFSTLLAQLAVQSRPPWLILASTREVYGACEGEVDEAREPAPRNAYGRTKAAAEFLLRGHEHRHGGRAATLRLANVYGAPRDHGDRVIPAFVRQAREGSTLHVRGSENILDFSHIDDAVRAIVMTANVLASGRSSPGILNVCSGTGTRLIDLAEMVVEATGSSSTIEVGSRPDDEVPGFVGANGRARELLAWEPATTLHSGLSALVREFDVRAREEARADPTREPGVEASALRRGGPTG